MKLNICHETKNKNVINDDLIVKAPLLYLLHQFLLTIKIKIVKRHVKK